MAPIQAVPPGAAPAPSSSRQAQAKQVAAKAGGTFNHVINVLDGISGNEAWLLKLFKEWLGGLKQFADLLNALSSAIQDLTSKDPTDPVQDAKTIIKDLRALEQLPAKIKGELTKMMEAKYGSPLPAKAEKFIKEATAKIQQLVNIVQTKLIDMNANPPEDVEFLAQAMLQIWDGETVSPGEIESRAAAVRAQMHTQDGNLTPTWYAINGFEGTLTQANQGAEFLNATVSAREQEIASEIQAVFTGISKTVDKQFKTIMMMIRGIVSR